MMSCFIVRKYIIIYLVGFICSSQVNTITLNSLSNVVDGLSTQVDGLSSTVSILSTSTTQLRTDLATEIATRASAVSTLTTSTTNLLTNLNSEIATRASAVSALTTSTTTLATNLANEITARTASASLISTATTQLRTDLASEIATRSSAVSALTTSTTALRTDVSLLQEYARVFINDNESQETDIENLESTLYGVQNQINTFNTSLNNEITTRASAVSTLTTATTTLATNLANEITARAASASLISTATTQLRTDLASEIATRSLAVSALTTSTTDLRTDVSLLQEYARVFINDNESQETDIENLESTLYGVQNQINTFNTSLNNEITTRASVVSTLTTATTTLAANLAAEIATRSSAVSTLTTSTITLAAQIAALAATLHDIEYNHEALELLRANILPISSLGIMSITDTITVGEVNGSPLSDPYEIKALTIVSADISISKPNVSHNSLSWSSMFGLRGDIYIHGQELILHSDLIFSDDHSIVTGGVIKGNGKRIVLSKRVSQFPSMHIEGNCSSLSNTTLILGNNVDLIESVTIVQDSIIDGNGFQLNLGDDVQIIVPDNVTLTLSNITLTGVSGVPTLVDGSGTKPCSSSIILQGANSKIRLENSFIIPRTNIYFDTGVVTIADNRSGFRPGLKKVEFGPDAELIDMRTTIVGCVSNIQAASNLLVTGETHIQGGIPMTNIEGAGNTIYFDDMAVWPSCSAVDLRATTTPAHAKLGANGRGTGVNAIIKLPVTHISFAPDGRYLCYVHTNTEVAEATNANTEQGVGIVRIDRLLSDVAQETEIAVKRPVKFVQNSYLTTGKRDGAIAQSLWRPRPGRPSGSNLVHHIALFWGGATANVFANQLTRGVLGEVYKFTENVNDLSVKLFGPIDPSGSSCKIPLATGDSSTTTFLRGAAWSTDGQFLAVAVAAPHAIRIYKISDVGQVLTLAGSTQSYIAALSLNSIIQYKQVHWIPVDPTKLVTAVADITGYKVQLINFDGNDQLTISNAILGFTNSPILAVNPSQPMIAATDGTNIRILIISSGKIYDTGIVFSAVQNNNGVTLINDISWSRNGTVLTIATDRGVKLLEFDPASPSIKPMIQNVPDDLIGRGLGVGPSNVAQFANDGVTMARDWSDSGIGLRTHLFTKNAGGSLSNALIKINRDFTIGGDVGITGDVTFDCQGHSFTISPDAVVTIASGKKLTIKNASIFNGLRGRFNTASRKNYLINLVLEGGSTLALDNSPIGTMGDVCFISGTVEIPSGDLVIATPYKVEFLNNGVTTSAKLKLSSGGTVRGTQGKKALISLDLAAKDFSSSVLIDAVSNLVTGTNNIASATDISVDSGKMLETFLGYGVQQQIQGFANSEDALSNAVNIGTAGLIKYSGAGSTLIPANQVTATVLGGIKNVDTGVRLDNAACYLLGEGSTSIITGTGNLTLDTSAVTEIGKGAKLILGSNEDDCIGLSLSNGAVLKLTDTSSVLSIGKGNGNTFEVVNSVISNLGTIEINAIDGIKSNNASLASLVIKNSGLSGVINLYENANGIGSTVLISCLDLSGCPALKFEDLPALYIQKSNYSGIDIPLLQLYLDLCACTPRPGSNIVTYLGTDGYTYVVDSQNNLHRLDQGAFVVRSSGAPLSSEITEGIMLKNQVRRAAQIRSRNKIIYTIYNTNTRTMSTIEG